MRLGLFLMAMVIAVPLFGSDANAVSLDFDSYRKTFHRPGLDFGPARADNLKSRSGIKISRQGGLCGTLGRGRRCGGDFAVNFTGPVSNLSFDAAGKRRGMATITAFLNGAEVGQIRVKIGQTVDFSALGSIDKLVFEHRGPQRHKRQYSNFNFLMAGNPAPTGALLGLQTTGPVVTSLPSGQPVAAVPIPPAAALFLSGLAMMGWLRRRRQQAA